MNTAENERATERAPFRSNETQHAGHRRAGLALGGAVQGGDDLFHLPEDAFGKLGPEASPDLQSPLGPEEPTGVYLLDAARVRPGVDHPNPRRGDNEMVDIGLRARDRAVV
jgi:hypothetical protein